MINANHFCLWNNGFVHWKKWTVFIDGIIFQSKTFKNKLTFTLKQSFKNEFLKRVALKLVDS